MKRAFIIIVEQNGGKIENIHDVTDLVLQSTPGQWGRSKASDALITDHPVGRDKLDIDYYGGKVILESCYDNDQSFIAGVHNILEAVRPLPALPVPSPEAVCP